MQEIAPGLAEWLERVEEMGAVAVRIRVGESRSAETVAILALEEHAEGFATKDLTPIKVASIDPDDVMEELTSNGWPGAGADYARLHAMSAEKGNIRSHVVRKPAAAGSDLTAPTPQNTPQSMAQAMGRLCLALERMADKNTAALGVVSEALAHREDVMAETLQEMVEAKVDSLESEREAVMAYAESVQEERDDVSAQAQDSVASLRDLLQGFGFGADNGGAAGVSPGGGSPPPQDDGGGAPDLDADLGLDDFLRVVDRNPTLFQEAIKDPRFVQRFASAHKKNRQAKRKD